LSENPLHPVYREASLDDPVETRPLGWRSYEEGLVHVGFEGPGFAYDNERPRHRVFLERYALADRLVTVGEYQQFIADGGYRRPELWLAEGYDHVRTQGWRAPLHSCEGYGV